VEVLHQADAPVSSAVATAVANGLADQVTTGQLAAATALAFGATPADAASAAARAVVERSPIAIEGGTETSLSGATAAYFGAAMVILFLYFTVQFGPRSLLDERDTHVLQRLLAAPITPAAILGGKVLGSLALGVSSIAVVIVLTTVLLDAHYGDPSGVALLSAATVLAVTAVVSLVTVTARTREQADAYASGVAIVFALIGGNFIDLTSAPAALRALAKLTPNGWALQGYDELSRGHALEAVVPEIAVLLAIAAVVGLLGIVRARRLVAM
jgi:ABC-2 type transport system permease protein